MMRGTSTAKTANANTNRGASIFRSLTVGSVGLSASPHQPYGSLPSRRSCDLFSCQRHTAQAEPRHLPCLSRVAQKYHGNNQARTRCLHCIGTGKIDKLKPVAPVATLLFLLAGHHQLCRAYLSVAI